MLKASDLITIPYTPDMTHGGIAYACKSLPYTYNRMGSSPFKRLQRIVAGVAVELAFRRHLSWENIPHDNLGATPFTNPDRYDIAIGGRRCDIKSFVLTNKKRIAEIRKNPACLFEAQALVPSDQIVSTYLNDQDLYIFAFLNALLTLNRDELEKARQADQPLYLIYALPKDWARPQKWSPLGELVLKSDAQETIKIELGGQDSAQTSQTEQLRLQPGRRVLNQQEFFALHYLHVMNLPTGSVGIHSPNLKQTIVIEPLQWGNIWVYGMEIILAGYMTRGEFRHQADRLPKGSRVFQYPRTSTDNLAMPIRELKPLPELFRKAKARSLNG
jgi:hypothetical protein